MSTLLMLLHVILSVLGLLVKLCVCVSVPARTDSFV